MREQPEQGRVLQLPEDGFEHPFRNSNFEMVDGPRQGKEHPRTVSAGFSGACCKFSTSPHQIVELRMCALSHHIREKPNWWEKVKDQVIVEKWREEALQQEEAGELPPSRKLTPTMVRFCYL